jgi:ferrochelatase
MNKTLAGLDTMNINSKEGSEKEVPEKIAVILYNLGGPSKNEDIVPFLFNLFYDKSIINIPNPFRYLLAKFISKNREKEATKNYNKLGGGSPLLANTLKQRDALQEKLDDVGSDYKVFVCMNFWHPMADETIMEVEKFNPSKIILLPLYPQFSTTTTGSFLEKWRDSVAKSQLDCPQEVICCYYNNKEFVSSYVNIFKESYADALKDGDPFVIFVAHGLPKKIVESGDPYKWQIERTTECIVKEAEIEKLDYILCYQSRVGPVEWIKPYADEVILEAAKENKNILVVPISFVSEHVETLVELDMEYRELAMENGAKAYHRAQTAGNDNAFIEGLKNIITHKSEQIAACPQEYCKCYRRSLDE